MSPHSLFSPRPPETHPAESELPGGLKERSAPADADVCPVWRHVRGMEKTSFCDWPGHIACVLFLGGCNLRCPTCHNPEIAWHENSLPALPQARVLEHLRRRGAWLDGLVVTGGEPTVHEALPAFLAELKAPGSPAHALRLKLDTNGMRPEMVERLCAERLADVFAVDVKGPYRLYPALTGNAVTEQEARARLERIFALAAAAPQQFYFRITLVPGLSRTDVDQARAQLPAGFALIEQPYVKHEAHHVAKEQLAAIHP